MTKPVNLRRTAVLEAEAAADYYEAEAGEAVALAFIAAYQAAVRRIGADPGVGPRSNIQAAGMAGLRRRRIERFPYLIFYFEQPDRVDIIRVLHAQRDLPSLMEDDGFP